MRYAEIREDYRANTEMWISPEGRVFYDMEPSPEEQTSYMRTGWIWAKSNVDGSFDVRHNHATRYAYDRLKRLIRQHDAMIATKA